MEKILALLLAVSMLCTACTDKTLTYSPKKAFESSVAFTADLHYLAQDDPNTSPLAQKMVYNREVVSSLLFDCKKNNTDTLLILGDLTNMGRKEEHEELISELKKAQKDGLDIYVIPGSYDLVNITSEEFANLYSEFGYGKSLSKDPASASYSFMLKDKLILMLDTAIPLWEYSGEINASTLFWLEEQLIYGKEKGLPIITASHHTLINHVPEGLENPYNMVNGDLLVELLDRYDVKLHLSGFRHTRQVNSFGSGQEIIIDMPIFYPNCYGMLYFTGSSAEYLPKQIDVQGYAKKSKIYDDNLRKFKEFSRRTFISTTQQNSAVELDKYVLSETELKQAQKIYITTEDGRAKGSLYQNSAELLQSKGYEVWQDKLSGSRYGRWMPLWLTECNEKTVGFVTNF